MKIEKIIAKKDDGDFLNYTIQKYFHQQKGNSDLTLLVDLIRTNVFKEVFDCELGLIQYQFGSSDDWSVRYGDFQQNNDFYIEFYDYWAEQNASEVINDSSSLDLNKLQGLKILSRNNLLSLIKSWFFIVQAKPKHIVITRDDTGWITLEAKDKLSADDLEAIE